MGAKCPDWLGAHLCAVCHEAVDLGENRRDAETRGRLLCLTLARLFDRGVLTIPGETHNVEVFF